MQWIGRKNAAVLHNLRDGLAALRSLISHGFERRFFVLLRNIGITATSVNTESYFYWKLGFLWLSIKLGDFDWGRTILPILAKYYAVLKYVFPFSGTCASPLISSSVRTKIEKILRKSRYESSTQCRVMWLQSDCLTQVANQKSIFPHTYNLTQKNLESQN